MPAKLQEYLKWEAQQESLLDNSFFISVILVWLLVSLLSAIGLFFFKSWAKNVYIIVGILGYLFMPLLGVYVDSGISYTLGEIATGAFGFIVALLLFTNVCDSK